MEVFWALPMAARDARDRRLRKCMVKEELDGYAVCGQGELALAVCELRKNVWRVSKKARWFCLASPPNEHETTFRSLWSPHV